MVHLPFKPTSYKLQIYFFVGGGGGGGGGGYGRALTVHWSHPQDLHIAQ